MAFRAAKAFYFLFFSTLSVVYPFIPVILERKGISKTAIGSLLLIKPFMSFFVGPVLCALADTLRRQRLFLTIAFVGGSILRWPLSFESDLLWVAVFMVASEGVMSCVSIGDALVNVSLGENAASHFGKVRMWGAVGWGVFAFVGGTMSDVFGVTALFILQSALIVLTAVPLSLLPANDTTKPNAALWQGLKLMCRVDVFFFFVTAFTSGVVMGLISGFLFVFLDSLGATDQLLGLTLTFTCAAEVPCFYFSDYVIQRWGTSKVMYLAMSCAIVRLLLYTILHDPWVILPIELLHGATFGLMWASCIAYTRRLAPPGFLATTQGILSGVYFGLGCGCGALFGGWSYDHFGPRPTFAGGAAVVAVGMIAFAVSESTQRCCGGKTPQKNETVVDVVL